MKPTTPRALVRRIACLEAELVDLHRQDAATGERSAELLELRRHLLCGESDLPRAESSAQLRPGQCVLVELVRPANNVDGVGGTVLAVRRDVVCLDVIAYAIGRGPAGLWHAAELLPMTVTVPWNQIHGATIFGAEDGR